MQAISINCFGEHFGAAKIYCGISWQSIFLIESVIKIMKIAAKLKNSYM